MPYIGNQPQYTSFLSDTFSGNGVTTQFTMTVAPANTAAVIVAIWGVLQDPTTYGVVGRILTFSQAPPTGTGNISVRYLSLPASNITTTAYRSVTEFTATAGQTTFATASYTPGFINVFRSGVRLGATNFTATNGATVVLTNAAAAGDLITVESFFVSGVLNAIPGVAGSVGSSNIAGGAVGASQLDQASGSGTGAMTLPTGTTAQRPASPALGMHRYNTTIASSEYWNGVSWTPYGNASAPAVTYLVVAGGGGGGGYIGGGGGAGGLLYNLTYPVTAGTSYNITVGAGGAPGTGGSGGFVGNNSTFGPITAIAGGAGGPGETAVNGTPNGGSGGGQGRTPGGRGGSIGTGTAGQGNAGGAGVGADGPGATSGGGGGGAGAVGGNGSGGTPGNGGAGLQYSISGTAQFYAGGGGGGAYTGSNSSGGSGVGGNGSGGQGTAATNPTAFTGSGGGSGGFSNFQTGTNGATGVVIIAYSTAYKLATATGTFTQTTAGGNYVFTFTGSGTITF